MNTKRFIIVMLCAVSFAYTSPLVLAAAPQSSVNVIKKFHGIRPTDPGGRNGLRNPGRGFRIQTMFAEPRKISMMQPDPASVSGRVPSGSHYYDAMWRLAAENFRADGLTLAQAYVYLTRFHNSPISEAELKRLQHSFDIVRKAGIKVILRFAYQRFKSDPVPSIALRLYHIKQLAPILKRNAGVIYALQAGFIGMWGEWHGDPDISTTDFKDQARIVKALMKALPKDRMVLLRTPKYIKSVLYELLGPGKHFVNSKTAHNGSVLSRLGMSNDGFMARYASNGAYYPTDGGTYPKGASLGHPAFDYINKISPYVILGGELYWRDMGGKINGFKAAHRMWLMHYSCFSLAHSYSQRLSKPRSIDRWITTPITPKQLRKVGMPFDPVYFQDEFGNPVTRSVFEYIRDHLGYRLELKKASLPKLASPGDKVQVKINLVNLGFSTIHNPRPVYIALVDVAGYDKHHVWSFKCKNVDPRTWQPYKPGDAEHKILHHTFTTTFTIPLDIPLGEYSIGLWMPDAAKQLKLDPDYSIRLANDDTVWWTNINNKYGINLMSTIKIKNVSDTNP